MTRTVEMADRPTPIIASDIPIGTPCTICYVNDRYPAEVVTVSRSGHLLIVKEPNGEVSAYTWRKGPTTDPHRGSFVAARSTSPRLVIGRAMEYRNPDI